jgi:hypothetical protein
MEVWVKDSAVGAEMEVMVLAVGAMAMALAEVGAVTDLVEALVDGAEELVDMENLVKP